MEEATLVRNPKIRDLVTTWNKGMTGFASINVSRNIRQNVGDVIDLFINDYLAVNPK
jgi:hypothetical protein